MRQGDHLRALRDGGWDHAIDLGDRTVIRWAPGRGVERCALADFVAGAGAVEVVVHRERVYRPGLVVARAFSRFAESAFSAMFRSSEQFATWCKNGQIGAPPAAGEAPAAKARRPAPVRRPRAAKPARKDARKAARRPAPRKAAPRKTAARRPAGKPVRKAAPGRAGRASPRKAAPRRGTRPARKRR